MSKRRTKDEILNSLWEFIQKMREEGVQEFFKTDVRHSDAKVHPDTAEDFFRIIERAQKEFPKLEVRQVRDNTLIRIIDESETFIGLIDRLITEMSLSKESIAELIALRTRLQSGKTP